MSDDTRDLDAPISPECETVDARLADYLDDAPDPALAAEVNAHLASCRRCAALVADLTGISAAARALPPLEPTRDLWSGIAARIDTAAPAVLPIETARRTRYVLSPRWRSLAAAAALVLVTAGVTYEVTKLGGRDGDARVATTTTTTTTTAAGAPVSSPTASAPASPDARVALGSPAAATPESVTVRAPATAAGDEGERRLAGNDGRRAPAAATTTSTYDHEIDALRRIVRERRSELDPKTLSVLEHNVQVIDDAIAQSRAALARDPRSRFLNEQLDDALDKKLELLRTAALLPARS